MGDVHEPVASTADRRRDSSTPGPEPLSLIARAGNAEFSLITSLRSPAVISELGRAVGNTSLARAIAASARERVLARDLQSDYEGAVKKADWKAAAEYLNGFNLEDIVKRLSARSIDEIEKLHAGALGNAKVGGKAQVALLTTPLLTKFAKQFPDAASLALTSPEAMRLVAEGAAANVKYGGFSEEGPGKASTGAWPYTVGDSIYVPKTRLSDKVMAMNGFLFEINNAVRAPRIAEISKSAKEGKIDATQFARKIIDVEVEGMLRLAKVWSATKAVMGGGKDLDKYDAIHYLREFREVEAGKKTAADIAADVGKRKYTEGAKAGKTVEENYIEQFNALYGKKK